MSFTNSEHSSTTSTLGQSTSSSTSTASTNLLGTPVSSSTHGFSASTDSSPFATPIVQAPSSPSSDPLEFVPANTSMFDPSASTSSSSSSISSATKHASEGKKDFSAEAKQYSSFLIQQAWHFSSQGTRGSMEDEATLEHLFVVNHKPYSFYAVFDGHGGHAAAAYSKDNLFGNLKQELEAGASDIKTAFVNAFHKTDEEFLQSHSDSSGTTVVAALLSHADKTLWVAHVGDSRAVLSRESQALALTTDHKADSPQEMERIKASGGFIIHKRVMGELAIARAIGDSDFKESTAKLIIATPDVTVQELKATDQFLVLACDGLYDVLENQEVVDFVRSEWESSKDSESCAKVMVTKAIDELHSCDNVSVILIFFKKETSAQ